MHISVTNRMPALTKKLMREATTEVFLRHLARGPDRIQHRDRRGQGEGQLLLRRRPGLLQVVAADVHRVPLGRLLVAPGDHVADQAQGRPRRIDVGAAGEILLDEIVLGGALQGRPVGALFVGQGDIERQQPRRRGVDGHRGVHAVERNAVEQGAHVADMADRHADLADLAAGQDMVGVVAGLGRQVEGDGKPGLALGQVGPIKGVGRLGGGMARIGAEDPRLVLRVLERRFRHGFNPGPGPCWPLDRRS